MDGIRGVFRQRGRGIVSINVLPQNESHLTPLMLQKPVSRHHYLLTLVFPVHRHTTYRTDTLNPIRRHIAVRIVVRGYLGGLHTKHRQFAECGSRTASTPPGLSPLVSVLGTLPPDDLCWFLGLSLVSRLVRRPNPTLFSISPPPPSDTDLSTASRMNWRKVTPRLTASSFARTASSSGTFSKFHLMLSFDSFDSSMSIDRFQVCLGNNILNNSTCVRVGKTGQRVIPYWRCFPKAEHQRRSPACRL
jgi:hypothetical protein